MTVVLTMLGAWAVWLFVSELLRAVYDGLLKRANERERTKRK